MDRFGSDKPDIRFGMELTDVSDVVKDCDFAVFKGALRKSAEASAVLMPRDRELCQERKSTSW